MTCATCETPKQVFNRLYIHDVEDGQSIGSCEQCIECTKKFIDNPTKTNKLYNGIHRIIDENGNLKWEYTMSMDKGNPKLSIIDVINKVYWFNNARIFLPIKYPIDEHPFLRDVLFINDAHDILLYADTRTHENETIKLYYIK